MEIDNIVLDEETILYNIKNMYNGNWGDMLDYYEKVTKCTIWRYYSVCDKAAYNGHLEILKYAHENGCPWDERTCAKAVLYKGHLEVLKYAHENGCPWDKITCASAAENGHLDILYYLYENEAPYAVWWGIHHNCKEFFNIYGEHWKKGDYTLNHSHLKPAKNKI